MSRQGLATGALAATVLLAAAGSAAAANWVLVGRNDSGSTYELDRDSFSRAGQQVTVSLRTHWAKPMEAAPHADGYLAKRRVYCAEGSFQDLHTDYTRQGEIVKTSEVEDKESPKPDSIAAEVVRAACAR